MTSGAITAQGAISAAGQTLGIGAITTSGDLTITHAVAKVKHTGATSFTIESTGTDGSVTIEDVTFDGDAVSGVGALGCGAITTTGAITVGFMLFYVLGSFFGRLTVTTNSVDVDSYCVVEVFKFICLC